MPAVVSGAFLHFGKLVSNLFSTGSVIGCAGASYLGCTRSIAFWLVPVVLLGTPSVFAAGGVAMWKSGRETSAIQLPLALIVSALVRAWDFTKPETGFSCSSGI